MAVVSAAKRQGEDGRRPISAEFSFRLDCNFDSAAFQPAKASPAGTQARRCRPGLPARAASVRVTVARPCIRAPAAPRRTISPVTGKNRAKIGQTAASPPSAHIHMEQ
jgi:hypothetical protein